MISDDKRQLLRHMVATVVFRGQVAIDGAPADFADFKASEDSRTPREILAHIGDLVIGSESLLRGEFIEINSTPLPWDEEVARFLAGARKLDDLLASDQPLAYPIEKFVQGPVGDALTHVGQIVLLRRISGSPVMGAPYFSADIIPGSFE
ncbi:MAG TPA: hypothetical protein VJV05_16170 [Pyrinomonadaceae bacterium]|nr:hypothetical protein [Pyrinomonadaceae bacterium]